MSSNWGDYNGDGRTDYVDYKIYTTQVDPYSGEYQRDAYKTMQEEYQRQQYQPIKNNLTFSQWGLCFAVAALIMLIVYAVNS